MKRRGDISLEYLVGLVMVLLILVALISFYDDIKTAIQSTFFKEKSIAEQDMERLMKEIDTLSSNERLEIYANGNDYTIALYASTDAPKECGGYSCACIKEKEKLQKCEPITKECPPNTLCILESSVFEVIHKEGEGRVVIPLCAVGNSVKLGGEC
ncbi:hypothetical protein HZA97_10035 [Candidatus Woesearchaeota archaeon]|nr:hypothetical protein [Candidatus Woesearchaeota archaeon]